MRASRIHRAPLLLVFVIIVVIGAGGGAGVYFAADRRFEGGRDRVDVAAVLDPAANDTPAQNYLIVGSDSRDNFDPENSGQGGCQCSDTLMILRRHPDEGASLLSIPRDTWVRIAGRGNAKINSAYRHGPETVIETISEEFGIPIHHYVEVDFAGFRDIVDAIGGVEVCVEHLAQDANTGMRLEPGCHVVDGEGGLSYARSRYYEEFIDGSWQVDPRADLGRIERQQAFIRSAAEALLDEVIDNPERIGDLVQVATRAITFDSRTDVLASGQALAAAAQDGIRSYTLPTSREIIGDQDAQRVIESEAEPILAYFRGEGSPPPSSGAAEATTADDDTTADDE